MQTGIHFDHFLRRQEQGDPALDPELAALLSELSVAFKRIADIVHRGPLIGVLGSAESRNIGGETQKQLDVLANEIIVDAIEASGLVAAMASEEIDTFHPVPAGYRRGKYLLVFDPLDGSSNIDINVTVGSIFSVLRCPDDVDTPSATHFLQPGTEQVAAGFTLYGPSVQLVLTLGRGVQRFTMDPSLGEFLLTDPEIRIPADTQEFAINMSNHRFWEPPVRDYIDECLQGKDGPRGKDFNMRWVASMVAEVNRILTRGGIFLYPRTFKDPKKPDKLRLMYEANPMSLICEQAGGVSSTARQRILEVAPEDVHQRIAVVLGARNEVERVVQYHEASDAA